MNVPDKGTSIDATSYGSACPQPLGPFDPPLLLTPIYEFSEDCLNLNVVRPNDTKAESKLPVMIYVHGGSFWVGSNQEASTTPDGLVLQSVEAQIPIIHVAINYRLGGEFASG